MNNKLIVFLLILSSSFSYAQGNFDLYYFRNKDNGKGDYVQLEYFLKKDSISGIVKTYHIVDMLLKEEKVLFKDKIDAASKLTLLNLVKREIKNKTILLFDAKNAEFLSWFEKEKKGYKNYFTFKVDGLEYYSFDAENMKGYISEIDGLLDLKIALTKWSAPKFYQRYMDNKKEEEQEKAAKLNTKKTKIVVSSKPENFKKIIISQLSAFENKEQIETKVTITNKGLRTREIISSKKTELKTDTIANFNLFKKNLNELVLKEKIQLQTPIGVRGVPAPGKTDGYIEIQMIENIYDHQDDEVEFVFSWMINSILKENKRGDYKTEISDSTITFLESVLYK